MNEENKDLEQNTNTDSTDSTAESKAYKELYEEQKTTLEQAQKEIADLKVANAKLAIHQSAGIVEKSTEELLNEMF